MDTSLDFKLIFGSLWYSRDTWLVISIIFLLVLALTRFLFPKLFLSTYSPFKFFSFKQREDVSFRLRLLSTEYLHFTFLLSAAIVLNLLLASDIIRSQSSLIPEWIYPSGIGEGILIWLGASVVLMLFFLLRYVMISTFGQLFNLPNGITQHFQEAQSLNQVFIMGITIISLLSLFGSFYYPEHAYQSIIVISLVYLVYRQFSLYMKFRNIGGYSKLFIFSYLCTTEIIPGLIGIKLLL